MIGFDLDGVLISDFNYTEDLSIEDYLEIRRKFPRTNFVPNGKYVIITGRNKTDYDYTMSWVNENLKSNPPIKVYHDCLHFSLAKEYKAKVINEINLNIFIESDLEQVNFLRQNCPNCKIIHFGGFINEALLNLRGND